MFIFLVNTLYEISWNPMSFSWSSTRGYRVQTSSSSSLVLDKILIPENEDEYEYEYEYEKNQIRSPESALILNYKVSSTIRLDAPRPAAVLTPSIWLNVVFFCVPSGCIHKVHIRTRSAAADKHGRLHIDNGSMHVIQGNDFNILLRSHGSRNDTYRGIFIPVLEDDFPGFFQLPVSFFAVGIV